MEPHEAAMMAAARRRKRLWVWTEWKKSVASSVMWMKPGIGAVACFGEIVEISRYSGWVVKQF